MSCMFVYHPEMLKRETSSLVDQTAPFPSTGCIASPVLGKGAVWSTRLGDQVVEAQWQSTGGYNQTALGFFFLGSSCGDGIWLLSFLRTNRKIYYTQNVL